MPRASTSSEMTRHELGETLFERLKERYEAKEQVVGEKAMRFHERMIMLSVLDGLWKDHLLNMDHLKEGIGLRGYGQQDPLVAYKKESFDMFEEMMGRFQEDTVRFLFLMQIVGPDGQPLVIPSRPRPAIPPAPAVGPLRRPREWSSAVAAAHERPAVPIPTRQPSTTIDEIEREFQRKKQRELEPRAWLGRQLRRLRRSAGQAIRSDATIPAHAAPARSTRSATERTRLNSS